MRRSGKLSRGKKGDNTYVPKITNAIPVIKWTQAFGYYLDRIIGHHTIPLSYFLHKEVTVPVHTPALVPGQAHSEDHRYIEADIVASASHTHALYRDDKSLVYYKLEKSTRSTPYTASIKPLQRPKNIWAAWLDLTIQYAEQDKWEQLLKNKMICYTHECVRSRATSPLKSLARSIGTNLSQCSPELNIFITNSLQNIHEWDTLWRESNAVVQNYKPQWPVLRLTQVHQGRETASKQQIPIFFHMNLCPRKEHQTSGYPVRSQTLEKYEGSIFGTNAVIGKTGVYL